MVLYGLSVKKIISIRRIAMDYNYKYDKDNMKNDYRNYLFEYYLMITQTAETLTIWISTISRTEML